VAAGVAVVVVTVVVESADIEVPTAWGVVTAPAVRIAAPATSAIANDSIVVIRLLRFIVSPI
jgi:hypothetical protein